MTRIWAKLAACSALVLVSPATMANSHSEHSPSAEELVNARKGGMSMSVFTLARLSAAANDERPLTGAAFPARGLSAFSQSLNALFAPQTQSIADTDALPAIWEQPEDFAAKIEDYQLATAALLEAAQTDNRENFNAALAQTKATCKACHDSYRKPQ